MKQMRRIALAWCGLQLLLLGIMQSTALPWLRLASYGINQAMYLPVRLQRDYVLLAAAAISKLGEGRLRMLAELAAAVR